MYNPLRLRRNTTSKPLGGVRTPGVLCIPTSEWSYNPSLRESLALAFHRLKVSMSMVLLLLDNRFRLPRSPKPCRLFVDLLQLRLSVLKMKICFHHFLVSLVVRVIDIRGFSPPSVPFHLRLFPRYSHLQVLIYVHSSSEITI